MIWFMSVIFLSLSLSEAVQKAIENNFSIKAFEYNVKSAQDIANSSLSYLLPKASASFSYTRQFKLPEVELQPGRKIQVGRKEQSQFILSLVQAFPIDFSVWYARKAVIYSYESQKWSYENFKNEIAFAVSNLYITLSNLKKAKEIAQENYERIKKRYETAQRLFDAGLIPKTDLLRIETSLYEAEYQMKNIDLQIQNVVSNLSALLTVDEKEISDIQSIDELIDVFKPGEIIEEERRKKKIEILETPDILSLKSTMLSLENRAKAERGRLFPQVSIGFSLLNTYGTFVEQRNIPSLSVGLSLNIDFGGSLFSYLSTTKRKISVMYQIEDEKLKKQKELENIFKEYEIVIEKLKVAEKRMEFAQKSLEAAQEFFEQGRITSVDLLDYELQFENAKLDMLNSKSELLLLLLKLKRAEGKILDLFVKG